MISNLFQQTLIFYYVTVFAVNMRLVSPFYSIKKTAKNPCLFLLTMFPPFSLSVWSHILLIFFSCLLFFLQFQCIFFPTSHTEALPLFLPSKLNSNLIEIQSPIIPLWLLGEPVESLEASKAAGRPGGGRVLQSSPVYVNRESGDKQPVRPEGESGAGGNH